MYRKIYIYIGFNPICSFRHPEGLGTHSMWIGGTTVSLQFGFELYKQIIAAENSKTSLVQFCIRIFLSFVKDIL